MPAKITLLLVLYHFIWTANKTIGIWNYLTYRKNLFICWR